MDIVLRTTGMATMVTITTAILAFPLSLYIAKYASRRSKGLLYLAVLLPLWSSYLVRVYAWKLIMAKEGILSWFFNALSLEGLLNWLLGLPVIGGPSLSVSNLGIFIAFVYVWLPYMILPIRPPWAGAEIPAGGLRRPGSAPAADFSPRYPAVGFPRGGCGLDFHLFAYPGRLHRTHRPGQFQLFYRSSSVVPPGYFWEYPSGSRFYGHTYHDHAAVFDGCQTFGCL
jgi:hypothetical protein